MSSNSDKLFTSVLGIGILVLSYYIYEGLKNLSGDAPASKGFKRALAMRLKRPEIEKMEFSHHEAKFAADIITCNEIEITFDDIGGMDDKLEEVKDNIVLPFEMWNILKSKSALMPCPTGLLLFGKPGTGKTMTAKAIAKEAGCTFINVKTSTLIDKYIGETDKAVTGLFELARKLSPSVIFIDEIDTLLSKRGGGGDDHKAYATMQGLFLQEWDGLSTNDIESNGPVIVLGATNRPSCIDKAFLRRMPYIIEIPLPNCQGRLDILQKLLKTEEMESNIDLNSIAELTEGFSGSDLKEFVRVAAMQRVKSLAEEAKKSVKNNNNNNNLSTLQHSDYLKTAYLSSLRPLKASDFATAILKTNKSMDSVNDFNIDQWNEDVNNTISFYKTLSLGKEQNNNNNKPKKDDTVNNSTSRNNGDHDNDSNSDSDYKPIPLD